MNGVLFREPDSVWPFQRIDIAQKAVDEEGRARALKEKCSLRILLSQGLSLCKLSFRTSILGFTKSGSIMSERPFTVTKDIWMT